MRHRKTQYLMKTLENSLIYKEILEVKLEIHDLKGIHEVKKHIFNTKNSEICELKYKIQEYEDKKEELI